MLGGGADIATTADVPITLAALNDQEFKTIATIAWSKTDIKVVARKDSGIDSPTDLRGKKIATTAGGGPLFFTHQFLRQSSISFDEVAITYMKPSDMIAPLSRGELDAIIIFGPHHLYAANQLGSNAIIFSPEDLYGETWNIVVRDDYIAANREKIKKFLAALLEAERFMQSNKDEALEIAAKHSHIDVKGNESYWDELHFELVLNSLLPDSFYKEAKWAMEQGITSRTDIPSFGAFLDSSFLQELKPDSIFG